LIDLVTANIKDVSNYKSKTMRTQNLTVPSELGQKAEKKLANATKKPHHKQTGFDLLRLNQELEVYQIELEMQNEELRQANEMAELVSEKYMELYNLAPVGYFTLNRIGEILELNQFGSILLNKNVRFLKNSLFGFFLTENTKPVFNQFLERVFITKATETCLVSMNPAGKTTKYLLLTGNVTRNGEVCLIAASDITTQVEKEHEAIELENFGSFFVGRELRMTELKKEVNELLLKLGEEKRY
jgi:hypothetical protein